MTAFILRRNLKIFVLSGLAGGTCLGIIASSHYGSDTGAITGLCTGILFGAAMYLILGFFHTRAVEKIAGAVTEKTIGTLHSRELTLDLPVEQAFDRCLSSLQRVGRCTVLEQDRGRGRIAARSSVNWKTWGDIILFDIALDRSHRTRITLSSRPSSRMTIVDYGKNLENLNAIVSFLKADQNNP